MSSGLMRALNGVKLALRAANLLSAPPPGLVCELYCSHGGHFGRYHKHTFTLERSGASGGVNEYTISYIDRAGRPRAAVARAVRVTNAKLLEFVVHTDEEANAGEWRMRAERAADFADWTRGECLVPVPKSYRATPRTSRRESVSEHALSFTLSRFSLGSRLSRRRSSSASAARGQSHF